MADYIIEYVGNISRYSRWLSFYYEEWDYECVHTYTTNDIDRALIFSGRTGEIGAFMKALDRNGYSSKEWKPRKVVRNTILMEE